MLAVIQRVREARVDISGETVGAIGAGLLVLVCAEPADTEAQADKLVAKLLKLRIFGDEPVGLRVGVGGLGADEHQQAGADRADGLACDVDARLADALDDGQHRRAPAQVAAGRPSAAGSST